MAKSSFHSFWCSSKSQEHIATLAGMLQNQNGAMRKIVTAVSQIDNHVKQGLALCNKSNSDNKCSPNGCCRKDPPFMKDIPTDPSEVKDWNSKPY